MTCKLRDSQRAHDYLRRGHRQARFAALDARLPRRARRDAAADRAAILFANRRDPRSPTCCSACSTR
eukprot:1907471-Pyramimonas_sp.AAC.1